MRNASSRSNDVYLEALRSVAPHVAGHVTVGAYCAYRDAHPDAELPPAYSISSRFGGWKRALDAAGLADRVKHRQWTREEAMDAVAGWLEAVERAGVKDYERASAGRSDLPSMGVLVRLFGGWKATRSAVADRGSTAGRDVSGR